MRQRYINEVRMSDAAAYDAQVRAIHAYNQPILNEFRIWLEQSGLVEKTVRKHVNNIAFFTEYLVYYDPLKKLDEAGSGDVWMFLAHWFPRKALWASVPNVKSNMASFKKFFQWMEETSRVPPEIAASVFKALKKDREHFLESAAEF